MKYSIFLFLFCIALFSCKSKEKAAPVAETPAAAPMVDPNLPVLTDEEKANGWKLLFDGTSTAGWHRYGGAPIGPAWKASDGSLMLDASNKEGWQSNGGGDIVTNEEYENYHLKIEWKIDT
ncbi:MAG: DUF1080 domain-containing protein, partial [Saprospiraceae bacterium]